MTDEQVTLFDNAEQRYFRWLRRNPNGYVINTTRGFAPGMMVLHRAACQSIRVYQGAARPGGFTERETVKVCAAELGSLEEWVKENGREDGSFSKECGFCKPRQARMWAAISMYTLHEAIRKVLAGEGGPLTARAIAEEINRRGWYLRRDHAPLRAGEVSARVRRHPELFVRRDGLVGLAG